MILLRPATLSDAAYLRRLRNDPEARKSFFEGSLVSRREHAAWLRRSLRSEARRLYVAHEGPSMVRAVGMGRLDFNSKTVELSLNVDPDHRGKGYGGEIVAALKQVAQEWKPGVLLIAHVKAFNTASLRAFLRAGFAVKGKRCLNLEAK